MTRKSVKKENFPPYYGPEWEKKISERSHPNFWKYGVADHVFLDFIKDKKTILDLGCGTGGSTRFIAHNSKLELIVGVDVVKSMIQVAQEKSREDKDRIQFVICDARKLPFGDSRFEALVSRGDVLPWLVPQDKTLQEFHRVMKHGAILLVEMDNTGQHMKADTTYGYFEKTHDENIVYVLNRIDSSRNHASTYYILKKDGRLAKTIARTQEFIEQGYYPGDKCSLKEIEEETEEIRQGLPTHWLTPKEARKLFEACGFNNIEVLGDGLLMRLLLERNEEIVDFMKKQPELLFEIEKKLIPFTDPEKTPTIIVKGVKK